jgi:methyl-accepting chemotaxis protein-2 (aspartate sensor receptor)
VHDSTREAAQVAAHGGTAIVRVESTMHEIQGSARRMAEIVTLIDGITFQTNILALNAAVEAARAGEQGRGFGVVAGEVRNLAQRASKAAGEIRVLIAESVAKVDAGAASVTQASNSMRDMVQSVQNINTLLADAERRASEQHTSIDQINQTVSELERVTGQNASLVQRTNAIADALTREAQTLVKAVSRFKLKNTATA